MAIIKTDIKQKTIETKISLKGVGLHTGKEVTITFCPAPLNNGFSFKRVDLEGTPVIEADANFVTNTQRGTCLEKNGVTIQTSEHVLGALVGLDVDNAIIELNAAEPPIMDERFSRCSELLLVPNVLLVPGNANMQLKRRRTDAVCLFAKLLSVFWGLLGSP